MNENISGWFVMLLGMGTVFFGLICLVAITRLMSFFTNKAAGKASAAPAAVPAAAPAVQAGIPNRPQFAAAVAAAIATEMGTEPSGLRIVSIEKK
ncbi:MAG: OadG family protein [Eubacteriales bacterium]|nr:OadG family protein [Eubacteriales bacterium]